MNRTFNYTGRRALKKDDINIKFLEPERSSLTFMAEIDLSRYKLPSDAQVYLEAYYRSSMMRFPYGTVAETLNYASTLHVLDEIQSNIVFFRAKVVDESKSIGRLIAVADKIEPIQNNTQRVEKLPLLYVERADLGSRLWTVEFSDEMPILRINEQIESDISVFEFVRTDPAFFGLVFPAVVERTLQNILQSPEEVDMSNSDEWRTKWLEFGRTLNPVDPFDDIISLSDTDKVAWIDRVVEAFCARHQVLENFKALVSRK
jgi:hypothetical protein